MAISYNSLDENEISLSKENNQLYKEPLVSIVIITYNSEKYILETLESAKSQIYQNIELIVSDDGSQDNTIEVCKNWIEKNKSRFVNTKLLTVLSNSGIPANCNRGIKMANGEWIKLIAGDDILMDNCVKENIVFLARNKGSKIILNNVIHFRDGTDPKEIVRISKPFWGRKKWPETAQEQYKALLLSYCGNANGFFIAKEVLDAIPYDERFPFIEDYPFVLNATKNGFYIIYNDVETVLYRIRNNSVYFGDNKRLFSDFYLKIYEFNKLYRLPFLSKNRRKYEEFNHKKLLLLDKWNLNNKTWSNKLIYNISRYLNIYRYLMFINDRSIHHN